VFNLFILGLTGASGTGKSYATQILEQEGFYIIDADNTARTVVEAGRPCLKKLCEVFGEEIINNDGSLNRKALAKSAFANKSSVDKLNFITHPYIIKEINAELAVLEQKGEKLVVLDAPTLFESGADSICDTIVAIIAPKELCLKRIIERDFLTIGQARERINAQPIDEYYTSRAEYVIINNDNIGTFTHQIKELSAQLKNLIKNG
jgi:dephospho-CoA kinase